MFSAGVRRRLRHVASDFEIFSMYPIGKGSFLKEHPFFEDLRTFLRLAA
jgi:hypothetical protein